jgi:uncharacterized protein (TIGR02284 family)
MTTDSVMNQTTSSDRRAGMLDSMSTSSVFAPLTSDGAEPDTVQINEDAIDTLNDLLEICRDGQYGFTECAAHTRASDVKAVLSQRAEDCRRAGADLMTLIRQMGGECDEGGTAMGALHRGWVAAKGKLTGYSDLDMLNECERAEDVALTQYRKALHHHLTEAAHAMVKQQASSTQRSHDQIKALRNSLKLVK